MAAENDMMLTRPTGEAIAALISPVIGLLAYASTTALQEYNLEYFNPFWTRFGAWIPNYDKIGPYSGKETIALVVWLVSWAILHFLLRRKNLNVAPWAVAFVIGITVAALLIWPPLLLSIIPE